MMMANLKLKYVKEYRDRTGKWRRYFRRGSMKGSLLGEVGSEEFMAAYRAYLANEKPVPTSVKIAGSLGLLITEYYCSRPFLNLKPSSRKIYRYVLEPLAKAHGHRTALINHKQAAKLIADIGATKPGMANLTKSVLQKLMKYGIKAGWRDDNPIIGIEPFKRGTHHTWTEGELKTFEDRWPLGTRQRLAYALLLYTGQRVGDVAKMKRADIVEGELHVIQDKTGAELYLPIVIELERAMRAYPAKGLSLIGTEDGRPLTRAALSHVMRDAIKAAGLPAKCVSHALRKAAMRRLLRTARPRSRSRRCRGHKSLREVERYTAAADQRRLAQDAMRTKKRT